jgi:23S rRNA (cytosine1962-C5)-methyltransferase
MKQLTILTTKSSEGYELLDSGEGEKLERFGQFTLRRPDPQALWQKRKPELWEKADASYVRKGNSGAWERREGVPERWEIPFGGLMLSIKPTAFKHTGLFPEQAANWSWVRETVEAARREVSVLNLFGYTGGASLAAAQAGAAVTHVDGSKAAIGWGKDNAAASGLSDKPIRWILDDAREFVRREKKRGKRYDAVIMDPPSFGHGPDSELWKIEEHFLPLLADIREILVDRPLFILINGYSAGYSALAYENNIRDFAERFGGTLEIGELALEESGTGRLLPAGIFARWKA